MKSMEVTEEPNLTRSERTRLRIMRTAERMFGSEGINGPSLRQIASAARQSNGSVIQYHFEDKDNLIREIMLTRVREMESCRHAMLKAAEESGQLDDLATLLRILCLPHIELRDPDGRFPFSEFLIEFMLRYRGPAGSSHPYDERPDMVPNLTRTLKLIGRRLHYMDAEFISRRSMTAVMIFLYNLISANEQGIKGAQFDRRIEDAILMGAQAMLAPLPPLAPDHATVD
ncbi:TetR/AcrR family transcriptional regulator [Novosphingobium mathurense]|uniref:Transcriptional regulator, TetR family n=1 Tax=Novosphingobium mathurense TaxID=428990 RepID=A0A1U6IXL1_9SPHN|nr:TetR/AcrR family transcriptional regulator [Novosphingobium mathurense]SLK12746.1 transcriptional regulator, TetR family [Novosphingobium mathurense]